MKDKSPKREKSHGLLNGLRVLDLGDTFAGAYCAGLLAGLGAEVIRVEPPQGDSLRRDGLFAKGAPRSECGASFLYLNAGKKSVTMDLKTSDGACRFLELAQRTDAVVEGFAPGTLDGMGLGFEALARRNPRLVLTSVTDFGQDGPYRDYAGGELVTYALGGLMYMTGEPDREPLRLPQGLTSSIVGFNAFTGTLMAIYMAQEQGIGQHVDVSFVETLLNCHLRSIPTYTHTGAVMKRLGNWYYDFGLLPCKDGYFGINGISLGAWERFCRFIGRSELLKDPRFADAGLRNDNCGQLSALVADWVMDQEKEPTFHAAQRAGMAFGYAYELEEVLKDALLHQQSFFVTVDHPVAGRLSYPGGPFQVQGHPWHQGRAPLLGEHSAEVLTRPGPGKPPKSDLALTANRPSSHNGRLPLEGVRVIDLGIYWAGAQCTRLLADMGAETIHIESPVRPDTRGPARPPPNSGLYPDNEPGPRPWNRNGQFNDRHRNKLSLCLDLKSPQGQEVLEDLVATSDVLVENHSARTVAKLGLSYDRFRQINPSLIMLSMPGFARSGPLADYISWGHTLEELSGASAITGYADGPPQVSWTFYSDPTSGILGAGAVTAALQHRRWTGHGTHIELSQLEATIRLVGHAFLEYQALGHSPERTGNRSPWAAPSGVYRCSGEDSWVAIEVRDDQEFQRLCNVLGKPDLARDPRFVDAADRYRNQNSLDTIISAWTEYRTHLETMRILQREGVRAGAVLGALELLADPHLAARGFYQMVAHPEAGAYPATGMHFKLSHSPNAIRSPAPLLGQHNRLVLSQMLGLDEEEVSRLEKSRTVATTPADAHPLMV